MYEDNFLVESVSVWVLMVEAPFSCVWGFLARLAHVSTEVSPACLKVQWAMYALENWTQRNYESSDGVAKFCYILF